MAGKLHCNLLNYDTLTVQKGLYFPPIHACPVVRVHVIVTQNSTNLVGPVFVWMFYDVSFDTSLHTTGIAVQSSPLHTTGTAVQSSPLTCAPNVMYFFRKY
jgi:hypothetical protein